MQRKVRMARVFRGKIAIPGDQMEAYFEALGQFEQAKAPMRTQLEQCAGDFERALVQRHWFRLMSDTHARFCWTTRLWRVMLLHRGISLS
jgi:hypothetical protein